MNKSSSHFRSVPRGFTLAEVVIGIAILSIVLMAMTTLTISSIRANQANIYRLTAYYLAQEGLEGMRNVRDSNWLQNYTWNGGGATFWGSDFSTDGYYVIDYYPFADSTSGNSSPWQLTYLGSSESDVNETADLWVAQGSTSGMSFYLHDHTSGVFDYTASAYSRYLIVTYPSAGEDIVEVTAVVQWEDHGRPAELQVSTVLTDWREGPI